MKKKILSLILTVAMLLTVMPMALAADEYSDVQGHWGEAAIDRWTQAGVAVGREEGTFAPDAPMTRGEAAQVLANLLRLKKEANISQYGDMDPSSSYYTAMAQCVAAGIFNGTSDTTMSPDSELTREQLFAIFARALGVQPVSSSSVIFADSDKVSDWALGYINALAELGAVRGVGNSELQPQADINRASVMSLLDQTISVYADTNGATVGESSGIVLVVADQVTVMGNVENLVVAGGSASVTGGSVTNASLVGSADLSVSGSAAVSVVMVSGEGASLNMSGQATVGSVAVAASATGASVEVTGSATVNTVATQANSVTISGDGTVNSAVVSGSNTIVNTTGTNLTVSAGATGVTQNGQTVSGGSSVETTPSTPGTSGGSGTTTPSNPTTPPVYIPNFYSVSFVDVNGAPISNYTAMEYSAVQFPNVPCEGGQQVTWYENGTLVADTSSVIVTSNRTFTAVVGSASFTAGNGTAAYPYLVANAAQFAAINQVSTAAHTYYEQIAPISVATSNVNFNGTYDGNGYSISAAATTAIGYYSVFGDVRGDSVIQNLTLMQGPQTALTLVSYGAGSSLTVRDIVIDSASNNLIYVNTNNFGFIIGNPLYEGWGINAAQTFLFEDITVTSNVRIANKGTCIGMVVGSGPCFNYSGSSVTYKNCVNNGTIIGTTYAGLLYGNPSYMKRNGADSSVISAEQFVVEGCTNNGTIIATNCAGNAAMCPKSSSGENSILAGKGYYAEQYTVSPLLSNISFAAYSTEKNGFTLSSEQAPGGYTYELVFSVSQILWSDGNQSNGIKVIVPATISTETSGMTQFTGANCHAYDKANAVKNGIITEEVVTGNAEGAYSPYVVVKADNATYKVNIVFLDSAEYQFTSDSSVTLMVYAYDANGVLAGVKQF